jgi:hypothetical protein
MTEYNFETHADVLKAIDAVYENKAHTKEDEANLKTAAELFLRTRTNSELLDMKDLEPSIWEYDKFCDWFYTEEDKRSWPTNDEMSDNILTLQEAVLDDFSGDKSIETRLKELEKQVAGIQKKVDRIVTLLESVKFEMSGAQALKL